MEQMPVLVHPCHWTEQMSVLVPLRLHHGMEHMLALVLLVRYVRFVRFAWQETPAAPGGHAACSRRCFLGVPRFVLAPLPPSGLRPSPLCLFVISQPQ